MPLFKDFNKAPKDLLTKEYADHGKTAFKVESKFKGGDKTVFVNPGATSKGVTFDLEYNMKPIKTKTTFDDKGGVKPKVTYEQDGHKVEASVDLKQKFEVVYEGGFGKVQLHDKLTNSDVDGNVSTTFNTAYGKISVGAGAVYSIEKSVLAGWTAGFQFADKGVNVNVVTSKGQTFTTGVSFPVKAMDKKFTVAAQSVCGGNSALKWAVGLEGPCLLCDGAKLKVKVDQSFTVSLAWIEKLSDSWKAAFSAEIGKDRKWGVTFTRE